MTGNEHERKKFGEIAVSSKLISEDQLNRALVVQKKIFHQARIHMPIGDVLVEMGALSLAQKDELLRTKRQGIAGTVPDDQEADESRKTCKEDPEKKNEAPALDVTVSKDKLTAFLQLGGDLPTKAFAVEDVQLMLQSQGIQYGVADENKIKAFLNGAFSAGRPWPIACGTSPVPGAPPEWLYHFDTDPIKAGTLTEDGRMDWKDRGRLPQVKEGALLAEMVPGEAGTAGIDVYGQPVPVPKPKEPPCKCGQGARRTDGGKRIHATVSGIPQRSLRGEVSVLPTLHIQGNVSLETGHIDFDGHIEVDGSIEKGFRVKGASLRAKEILEAEIDVTGDMVAIHGIFGAVIRSEGNLKAGHIHNTKLRVDGDLTVEKEIIDSRIEANGRCTIQGGIILSSTVSAKMGIVAMDVGTQASSPSELIVGIDHQLAKEADDVRSQIRAIRQEKEALPEHIKLLQRRSDQLNTTLGEVAQQQDKCMVQHRTLQEKSEAAGLQRGEKAAETLQQTIEELERKQKEYDEQVAQLMEEDEALVDQIKTAKETLANSDSSLAALQNRLAVLVEAKKTDRGVPVVKVGGNLFAGTKIRGPNSFQTIERVYSRLSIVEKKDPAADGGNQWRLMVCPFTASMATG